MAECAGCRAEIDWAVTTSGSTIPIDPAPTGDGNVVYTGRRVEKNGRSQPEVRVLAAGEQSLFPDPEERRFVSHFVSCPDADRFRREVS